MSTIDDDAEEMARAIAKSRRVDAERLEAAKADAMKRGKQPFDLATLETLCDTSHEGRLAPPDERREEFEWMYYVIYPEVLTLAEFATHVDTLNRW